MRNHRSSTVKIASTSGRTMARKTKASLPCRWVMIEKFVPK